MGRLNLIVPDDFEEQFRNEVFNRKGFRKGNLTEAIIEAMKLWMGRPHIEKLKKTVLDPNTLPTQKEESIEAIAMLGESAIGDLIDIAINKNTLPSVREKAIQKVKELLGETKIDNLQKILVE